ncbi:PREDICTED: PI-PLC X domain-containing protein 3 isoform X1 [Eufriesea mexicana]|uniref:PI-PLC X domain-containing protein 3 isoform X1 n=2 Tax=Eufriesea mexicana TaxID=516756 RepID=UPI00083C402E|nr:PREDICTED: PI-PLC X domain-containing protein 3 isoform X1 [Eufriesea mexicana]
MEYKTKDTSVFPHKPKQKDTTLNQELEYWMTRLPDALKNLPIIHLAIPGSHNTMTYTINRNNDVGPDEPRYIRALGRYCSFVSKPILFNWSITQHENIKNQLDGGIRYLDLRVATKPTDGYIYFVHGLYGSKIYQPLQEIAEWLSYHSNEIVILDFQHFYSFSEMNHRHLIETIFQLFRTKLCPLASTFDHITLHWLNLEKYQVVIIYRNAYAQNYSNLWPSGLWRTPWPNTVRVNELINFLDIELKARSLEIGFISQCVLTPDIPYVLKHLCGTLQRNLVSVCQKTVISWVNQKRPGHGGLNIVIADFISDNNFLFCKTVIDNNKKFLNAQYSM